MKKIRRLGFINFILIVSLFFFSFSSVGLAKGKRKGKPKAKGPYAVSAKSAIFSDSTNVKRLYGKNVHAKVFPASTTKVMTALLVLEKLSLDKEVAGSSRATQAAPTKINLK